MNEETLFQEALSRPPEERTAFLEQACAGRPDLRAAAEALLTAHEKPGDVPDKPPANPSQAVNPAPGEAPNPVTGEFTPELDESASPRVTTTDRRPPTEAGAVIAGRYTLVEKIGEGGMGEVWVAKQTEPVKRKVALKLIKAGMDTKSVLRRFEQERQALALMEHPNIARVIDGGMTAEHRPFFVMELVNGLPLTKFCDEAKMGIRGRLELFTSVCQAVQHAHGKGIIHRDLKPSNILVTIIDGKPMPKVIDFGVAKATSGRLTDESLSTRIGAVVGTLEYMSPEQAGFSGEDIDTRADIYSLGVILYELLTGLRPISAGRLKKAAFTEMIRLIREEEPSKPSTRLSTDESAPSVAALRQIEPKKLAALLRGELDWVVMKCLEKQRDRRYETANGLAREIQRYLADEPVEARPPSKVYRLGKFLRRNKGPVIAAGLVLLVLLCGIVGTSWGLFRALAAERLAGDRLADVEKSRDETAKALTESEVARKQATAVADFLVNAFQKPKPDADGRQLKVVDLLDKAADTLAADKDLEALTRARLQSSLGETFFGLGLPEKAVALHEKALATYQSILGADDPKTLTVMYELSYSLGHAHRHAEAIRVGEETLARRKVVLGPEHADTLLTMTQLAGRYWSANRLDLAIPLAEQSLAAQRKLLKPENDTLPNSIAGLGMLYKAAGRTAEAVKLHEEAVAIRKATKGPDHAETLLAINVLGQAYEAAGQTADAVALQRDTAARMETKFGPDHPRTLLAMSKLARTYVSAGKAAEALPVCEKALQLAKQAQMPDTEAVLRAVRDLAWTFGNLNRESEALALLQEAVTTATAKYGPNHDTALAAMYDLGIALRRADKQADAIPVLEQVLAVRKVILSADDRDLMMTISQLAFAYDAAGRPQEAIPLLEKLLEVQKAKLDPDHRDVLVTTAGLGLCYATAMRTGDAVRLLEQAAAAFQKKYGPKHPDTQTVTRQLAAAYMKDNRLETAGTTYRDLLAVMRPSVPADSRDLAATLVGLGEVLLAARKFPEAEGVLREGLVIREKKAPEEWGTFDTKSLLGGALLGQEKYTDAEPLLLQGYEGMNRQKAKIPPNRKVRLPEAVGRLVQLYEESGKKADVARWRKELEAVKTLPAKPEKKP